MTVGTPPPPPPPGNAVRIAGGNQHSTVLLANGTLQSWGSDSAGALGGGSDRNVPGPVASLYCRRVAGAGRQPHTRSPQRRQCLGLGLQRFRPAGRRHHEQCRGARAGERHFQRGGGLRRHAAFAGAAGRRYVRAFGVNWSGQIGDGTNIERLVPTAVPGIGNATAIACGGGHSLILLADFTIRAFGRNNHGQLGDGTMTNSNVPIAVGGAGGVTAIAAGFEHSLALLGSGAVVAWGSNSLGQLGDNTRIDRPTPVPVVGFSRAFSIAAGGNTSLALGEVLFAWGSNSNGQLGIGALTPDSRVTAEVVPAFFRTIPPWLGLRLATITYWHCAPTGCCSPGAAMTAASSAMGSPAAISPRLCRCLG